MGIEAPPKADLVHDGLALCNRRPRTNCPSVALSTVIPHNGFLSLLHESATLSNNYLFQRAVSSWGNSARWFANRRRRWISVAGKYQDARAESPQLLCQLAGGWLGYFVFRSERTSPRRGPERAEKPQGVTEPGESGRGRRHTSGRTREMRKERGERAGREGQRGNTRERATSSVAATVGPEFLRS